MKVAFYIWSLGVGGAERFTLMLGEHLRRRGIKVTILVQSGEIHSDLSPPPELEILCLKRGGFFDLVGWRVARHSLAALRADLIVSVNPSAMLVALTSARRAAASLVFSFHTTKVANIAERLKTLALAWASNSFYTIFCSSNQELYWRTRGFFGPAGTIHNGVDCEIFHPASNEVRLSCRRDLGIEPDELVLGLVAAFRPEKDHRSLVLALKRLKLEGFAVRALLVGDGPTRPATERLVVEYGLQASVMFIGQVSDVRPLLAAIDVGILCSKAETFSLAALEMMACGKPMILTDVGGASEIVNDGRDGFIVPPGDVEGLSSAIRNIFRNGMFHEMSNRARQKVTENYSIQRMIERYIETFSSIASARHSSEHELS